MPYGEACYIGEALSHFDPKGSFMGLGKSKGFPADFIAEGLDQTRGWFYSMMVLGVALFGTSPFKNVVVNGLVLAEDGRKMSKSLKNYSDPMEVINRFGADAMRYFLISSPVVSAEDLCFSDKLVDEVLRKNINRIDNVLSFYEMYAGSMADRAATLEKLDIQALRKGSKLDAWMIARLEQTAFEITEAMEAYQLDKATRPLADFIDDLSTWYVRRSRDRFKSDDKKTQEEAIATTKYILREFAKVLAPIMPFTAEMIWSEMKTKMDPESVHLCVWGNVEELESKDVEAIEKMELVREMVTNILEERNKAAIKVRQPLAAATFKTAKFDPIKTSGEYLGEVMDETNVRSLNFVNPHPKSLPQGEGLSQDRICELDTNITEELKVEGVYRELVRTIQDARKLAGLKVGENVNIQLPNSLSEFEKQVVESKKAELQKECNLNEISWGETLEILR
jgi:isoleucyl-tRNA synthetase